MNDGGHAHHPRPPPSLRLGQLEPARADRGAGRQRRVRGHRRVRRPARCRVGRRRGRRAGLRQGQPGHRTGLRRRRRTGRRAEGHDRVFPAIGLGLDRGHSRLRLARRPVHRTGAQHLEVRRPGPRPGALRPRWAGAAETLLRHHRCRAGRGRAAFDRAAAPGRRQHGYPRPLGRHRALSADRGRWRAVLGRRHPCRPGRRRSLRHGDRKSDVGRADLRPGQGRQSRLSTLRNAGPGHAPPRRKGLPRHHRHRART